MQRKRECQKILYDKFSRQMYSICLRYHSDVDMANEALQRGFIKVFEKLENYKGRGNLGAWIRAIIVRKCIDLIKEQKKLKYENLDTIENHEVEWDRDDRTYHRLDYKQITALLEQLPLGYRTVFSMYILDGLKHDEIASTLGISVATSRSQLFKARKMMLELVQENFNNANMQKC